MSAAPFAVEIAVRWGDMDAFGHVNNATYLDYIQEARAAWFETVPGGWGNDRIGPVVGHVELTFRQPIVYPARVRITLVPHQLSERRLLHRHRLVDADDPDTLYAEAELTIVWIDKNAGRAVELPEGVRKKVEREAASPT